MQNFWKFSPFGYGYDEEPQRQQRQQRQPPPRRRNENASHYDPRQQAASSRARSADRGTYERNIWDGYERPQQQQQQQGQAQRRRSSQNAPHEEPQQQPQLQRQTQRQPERRPSAKSNTTRSRSAGRAPEGTVHRPGSTTGQQQQQHQQQKKSRQGHEEVVSDTTAPKAKVDSSSSTGDESAEVGHAAAPAEAKVCSTSGGGGGGGSGGGGAAAKGVAPKLARQLSVTSGKAFTKIHGLEEQFASMAKDIEQLEKLNNGDASLDDLLQAKQHLAQVVGNLDKFQFESVDAISTAELESGREEVRQRRKQLTKDVTALRDRVMALFDAIVVRAVEMKGAAT